MRPALTTIAIARASLLERARSTSFLVTLVVTGLSAWRLVPPAGATSASMHFGDTRVLNTAAGVGLSVACMGIIWLSLIGFYLVNASVRRDEETGVGQIIATTQVGKATYLLGKALANLGVLLAILGCVCLTMAAALWFKGEGGSFDLAVLWLPVLVLAPPPLAFVSALAMASEVLLSRWRGAVNVGYFFAWTLLFIGAMLLSERIPLHTAAGQVTDVFAMREVTSDLEDDLVKVHPDHRRGQVAVNFPFSDGITRTFEAQSPIRYLPWWGVRWLLVGVSALIVAALAVPFRRFDPSSGSILAPGSGEPDAATGGRTRRRSIPAYPFRSPFLTLLQAELRLMLLGRSRWWWGVSVALFVASAVCPLDLAHRYLVPALWLWHVLALSRLGSREVEARTTEIVFGAPRPLMRQLPAALGAATVLLFCLGLPVFLRELAATRTDAALGVLVGAFFVAALAFALGTWTNGGKAFELSFTVLWYGAANGAPPLDFTGSLAPTSGASVVLAYFAAGAVLAVLGLAGRARQLRG